MRTEQAVQGLQAFAFCAVKNVNGRVVFRHFEDLEDLIVLNISKFKMISKFMIKFQTKWQVPPSFQPSHFGYYFGFSWFRFKYTGM